LAAAYADLLEAEGEAERAEQWRAAVMAVDADDAAEGVEFLEAEEEEAEEEDEEQAEEEGAEEGAEVDQLPAGVAAVVDAPEEHGDAASSPTFDAEVEAEVAELLGEAAAEDGADGDGPSTSD
jgi:hypothetical protein